MEELKKILVDIMNVYNEDLPNDQKHQKLAHLWTLYYKMSDTQNMNLEEAENLYLLGENESYIIDQKPERKKMDSEKVIQAVEHLKEVLSSGQGGISIEEAKTILDWDIEKTRSLLQNVMGLSLETNSLNGFCELCQGTTILPLERIGLKVTKNTAKESFGYPWIHAFGSVTFPIAEQDEIKQKTYLIDSTYRQFFSTTRCNEGRYYAKEENTGLPTAPDPGYFVENIEFAKELMKNGYIELTKENAELYGKPFYLSSVTLNQKPVDSETDYFHRIVSSAKDYCCSMDMIKESAVELDLPARQNHKK